ncbi:MAG: hypothetical protein B7Y98_12000 [Sphingomonas sp. 32-62-10]|nr:MAG: hypothetical protein B7Z43_04925 [Sphingomonas sp. 12-62-6]OYX37552.1 MAG: hypothetical protein B7Y98_12000 [Sphingomonas sp. 32-62-10]
MHFEVDFIIFPSIIASAVLAETCAPYAVPSSLTPPTDVLGAEAVEVYVKDCALAVPQQAITPTEATK